MLLSDLHLSCASGILKDCRWLNVKGGEKKRLTAGERGLLLMLLMLGFPKYHPLSGSLQDDHLLLISCAP